tara:strand:- start:315 stop:632 length:318 start_codon:yes stop_codon:yes gene_type:complete
MKIANFPNKRSLKVSHEVERDLFGRANGIPLEAATPPWATWSFELIIALEVIAPLFRPFIGCTLLEDFIIKTHENINLKSSVKSAESRLILLLKPNSIHRVPVEK